jgi:hypothetical protein
MREERDDAAAVRAEPVVQTRAERELAVSHWLVCAADDMRRARDEWAHQGVALLRCGGLFAAVRVPGDLVRAAAGAHDRRAVGSFLSGAVEGGPVFVDETSACYYFLVPAGVHRWWTGTDAPCLGRESFIGVPHPRVDGSQPDTRTYWCVPMDAPGDLCEGPLVQDVVRLGRARGRRPDPLPGPPAGEGP